MTQTKNWNLATKLQPFELEPMEADEQSPKSISVFTHVGGHQFTIARIFIDGEIMFFKSVHAGELKAIQAVAQNFLLFYDNLK